MPKRQQAGGYPDVTLRNKTKILREKGEGKKQAHKMMDGEQDDDDLKVGCTATGEGKPMPVFEVSVTHPCNCLDILQACGFLKGSTFPIYNSSVPAWNGRRKKDPSLTRHSHRRRIISWFDPFAYCFCFCCFVCCLAPRDLARDLRVETPWYFRSSETRSRYRRNVAQAKN